VTVAPATVIALQGAAALDAERKPVECGGARADDPRPTPIGPTLIVCCRVPLRPKLPPQLYPN
jgi:hypothetical protein